MLQVKQTLEPHFGKNTLNVNALLVVITKYFRSQLQSQLLTSTTGLKVYSRPQLYHGVSLQLHKLVGLWKNVYVLLLCREAFLDGLKVCEVLSRETQILEGEVSSPK